MKVRVRCAYDIEIELPDDWDSEQVRLHVEENCCPGTGKAWRALDIAIKDGDRRHVCWACALNGSCKVLT